MVSVAPNCFAHASFFGTRSMAMMRPARASRAPCTTLMPTAPQPNTATRSPRLHLGREQRRAHTCHDTAADQTHGLGRQSRVHHDRLGCVHDRVAGKGAEPEYPS